MSKSTLNSIEWLWEQIDGIIPYQDINTSQLFNGVLEQAKEMHYKELMGSMQKGMELQEKENTRIGFRERNGLLELPQQEISDEEIEDEVKKINLKFGASFSYGFILAIKWYREQLKQL